MTKKNTAKEKPNDPNKQYYFNLLNRREQKSFIQEIISHEIELGIWKQGQDEEELETFTAVYCDAARNVLTLNKRGSFLNKLTISELADCDVFFKVEIGKLTYFTNGHLIKDLGSYLFHRHGQFYKSQQRQNYRLNASKHIIIQFKMDDQVFEGLDVSAGGVNIAVPIATINRFKKGSELEGCTLRLNKGQYSIPKIKIISSEKIVEGGPKGGEILALGIQFTKLPKVTEEDIRKQIFFEARGEEIRKKFNLG